MKSTFEELGGTYKQVGDYLLPDVEVPENSEVGFWGMQRRKYLLEHQSALYTALFLGGKLADHLQEIDRSATQMFDQLVDQLKIRFMKTNLICLVLLTVQIGNVHTVKINQKQFANTGSCQSDSDIRSQSTETANSNGCCREFLMQIFAMPVN